MENAQRPEPVDPREQELELDVLRSRLSREKPFGRDLEKALSKLRHEDVLADEIVRHLAEKYFPGRVDMAQKEKAVHMLVTAFLIKQETKVSLDAFNVPAFLAEVDRLSIPTAQEPPDTAPA